jgi:periplasmic protein TonB
MTAYASVLAGQDGGADVARWSLAAAVVVTAHTGLMAGYLLLPPQRPEGAPMAPAVIVELAPLPVAPASPVDLAPGPRMIESQSTPEATAPIEKQVVEPIPKIEAPAEVVLPLPEPKPVEAKPEPKPPDAKKPEPVRADRKPPAPQTTASPRSKHRTAPVARAPSPGSTASRAAISNWRHLVVARLQRAKRYPSSAESRREQGVVTLSFTVNRNGRVLGRRIVRSSGHSSLDGEVLAMVARAQPLPAFPAAMTQSQIHLTVPIRFSLR